MDITSNLLKFLQTNAEADLGTFGVFTKKRITGHFDKTQKAFIPPRFELNFTAESSGKSDRFLDFVSAKNNISIKESRQKLESFFDDIKTKLAQKNEAEVKGFGKFSTENGTINFKADDDVLIGGSYFGMPNVSDEEPLSSQEEKPSEDKEVNSPKQPPLVENIELDEVETDFANTLSRSDSVDEKSLEVPEPVIEQHEEHPDKFGKTQYEVENGDSDEKEMDSANEVSDVENIEAQQIEVPGSVIEQHEEHPGKFGSAPNDIDNLEEISDSTSSNEQETTPIVEPPLTLKEKESIFANVPLEEKQRESVSEEHITIKDRLNSPYIHKEVVSVPEAIIEQHEEHPDRFGADPMEQPTNKSIWPKVLITFIILLIIGGLVYFFQPNLFNRTADPIAKVVLPTDSTRVQPTAIDAANVKQDSTAKADSVLKANMVQTAGKDSLNGQNIANNEPIITFDVIVASYKTEKAANNYVSFMKSKGYDAKIANMTGMRKKISIASFSSEQEAKKQLVILQKKLKGKGFYVQKIKTP